MLEFPRLATARSKSANFVCTATIYFLDANIDDRIEVAVKQILSGLNIKTNASVANPEALEWFKEWAKKN